MVRMGGIGYPVVDPTMEVPLPPLPRFVSGGVHLDESGQGVVHHILLLDMVSLLLSSHLFLLPNISLLAIPPPEIYNIQMCCHSRECDGVAFGHVGWRIYGKRRES